MLATHTQSTRNSAAQTHDSLLDRLFTVSVLVLVLTPIFFFATCNLFRLDVGTQEGLSSLVALEPSLAVGLVTACIQPFVAYLLWFIKRHVDAGETSYARANLCVLLASELALQNIAGTVALSLLLWRTQRISHESLLDYLKRRKVKGILLDISGGLLTLTFALLCAWASAHIAA